MSKNEKPKKVKETRTSDTVEIGCMSSDHHQVPYYFTVKRGEPARCPVCKRTT